MTKPCLLLLLLMVPLSACLGVQGGACDFDPSPIQAGVSVEYDATGPIRLPSFNEALVDWSIVGASGGQEMVILQKGDKMRITIGMVTPILSLSGGLVPGLQVTYSYFDASRNAWIAGNDEWINPHTGDLIQYTFRAFLNDEIGVVHTQRFSAIQYPGLFAASIATGAYTAGRDAMSSVVQIEQPSADSGSGQGRLEFAIEAIVQDGDCHLVATGTWRHPVTPSVVRQWSLRLGDLWPLPDSYEAAFIDADGAAVADSRMVLANPRLVSSPGFSAASFAPIAIQQAKYPVSVWPLAAPANGFLKDSETVFPLSLEQAIREAKADAAGWFDEHPEARAALAEHRMGRPDSNVADAWGLAWSAPDGSGLQATVTKNLGLANTGLSAGIATSTQPRSGLPYPDVSARPSLADIAAVADRLHGSLEFLLCDFARDECKAGRHAFTNQPFANPLRAQFAFSGIVINISKGWVVQDTSSSTFALPPPADAHLLG